VGRTPDWKLDCFYWLPHERWVAASIISHRPENDGTHYCKVCDAFVAPNELEPHATVHRNEVKALAKRRKRDSLKRAREASAIKRRENAALNE